MSENRVPCSGTPSYTSQGLENELKEIKATIKQLEQKLIREISEVKVIAEQNKSQNLQIDQLKEEVSTISTQVSQNKSFSDRALGGLGVLMAVVAIAEVFLLFKPPSAAPPLPLPAPVTELYPNAN